ncbi:GHKL domain-containing protein [Heliobacterium gestii]|uniref:histidine kinase n=1 Tax=Heliomicrobium gestii TaxID=2699 RepID=A0A845L7T0_HELGE|nr:ATP-binding protein [Heliomicrobium gestii]MBM7865995.1 PAS domain-containing protein [Heliomicrobium gestii]MZP42672.1 GHKL domain-containing protein [Heliomicrobium gestii]
MESTPALSIEFGAKALAERLSRCEVEAQTNLIEKLEGVRVAFNALPHVVMVLNRQRQIIFCNSALLELLGDFDTKHVLGVRPGEVLRCVHAQNETGGCGTAEPCRTCGAFFALMNGVRGKLDCQDCRISVRFGESFRALDVRVLVNPIEVQGQFFSIVNMTDISHEKRRKMLERIFFHDVMNTAGGLQGLLELGRDVADLQEAKNLFGALESVAGGLVEEIAEQRDLIAAENDELKVIPAYIRSRELLHGLVRQFCANDQYGRWSVRIDEGSENATFLSSPVLLRRVLKNMLKNAVEASPAGAEITAGCRKAGDSVEFWVNNPVPMTREVQLQVFKRSFSTKGEGRGIGTYSMKLLTERYLNGRIHFDVSPESGTTFVVAYPIDNQGWKGEEFAG